MAGISIQVNIDGLPEITAKLDNAQRALEPPSLTESMATGADIFVDLYKEFAPVETGTLAGVMNKRPGDGPASWVIGPVDGNREITPYANIQDEGGTNIGNYYMVLPTGQRFHTITIPGTNYAADAFALGRDPAIEVVKEEVIAKMGL